MASGERDAGQRWFAVLQTNALKYARAFSAFEPVRSPDVRFDAVSGMWMLATMPVAESCGLPAVGRPLFRMLHALIVAAFYGGFYGACYTFLSTPLCLSFEALVCLGLCLERVTSFELVTLCLASTISALRAVTTDSR